jgi:hypothetical protein
MLGMAPFTPFRVTDSVYLDRLALASQNRQGSS